MRSRLTFWRPSSRRAISLVLVSARSQALVDGGGVLHGRSRTRYTEGVVFEWDPAKADENLRKHEVSFDEATSVFGDFFGATVADPDHSVEKPPAGSGAEAPRGLKPAVPGGRFSSLLVGRRPMGHSLDEHRS